MENHNFSTMPSYPDALANHSLGMGHTNMSALMEEYYVFPVPAQAVLGIVLVSAALVSVVGNSIACIVVYRKTVMRSAINLLLANMATGDILLSIFCLPFIFYRLLSTDGSMSYTLCMCFDFVQLVLISTIAYTLVAISADRFLIIVHKRDKLTPKSAKIIICATWCCSLLLSCPPLTGLFRYESRRGGLLCDPRLPSPGVRDTFTVVTICVAFYLPMIVMFYTYICILKTVRKISHRIHNFPGSTISVSVTQYSNKLGLPPVVRPCRHTVDMHTKRRAFGTIFILYIVFLSCWFPYMVNMTVLSLVQTTVYDCKATVVLVCLGFLKSALYPVVYAIRNRKFREACFKLLPKSFKFPESWEKFKQRRVNPSSVYEYSDPVST